MIKTMFYLNDLTRTDGLAPDQHPFSIQQWVWSWAISHYWEPRNNKEDNVIFIMEF